MSRKITPVNFKPYRDLIKAQSSEHWMESAACRGAGPQKFFPSRGQSPQDAKDICGQCPVVSECHDYAVENKLVGTWGGTVFRG